jgi:catechol O-methyltransferase
MLPIKITSKNYKHWFVFGWQFLTRQIKATLGTEKEWKQRLVDHVFAHSQQNDPNSVLEAMDNFAQSDQFMMNVGEEKGEILDRTIIESKAVKILELGSYCGYSAVRIGRLLQQGDSSLISIEKNPAYAEIAQKMVLRAGLEQKVTILTGEAKEFIPTLKGQFDVVFLDHWKDLYLPDLQLIEQCGLLKTGSIVVADNVGIFENSLQEYLHYVRESGKYKSTFYRTSMEYNDAIEDGVEVSIWLNQGMKPKTHE